MPVVFLLEKCQWKESKSLVEREPLQKSFDWFSVGFSILFEMKDKKGNQSIEKLSQINVE